jgi:hypothetical protein
MIEGDPPMTIKGSRDESIMSKVMYIEHCDVSKKKKKNLQEAKKKYRKRSMSCKFQIEFRMNYILLNISVYDPLWNRSIEQVAC